MQHFAPHARKDRKDDDDKDGRKNKDKDKDGKNNRTHRAAKSAPNNANNNRRASGLVSNPNHQESAVTALRIFRPPLGANVTLREGRPLRIACPKRKEICGEILWAAGPWRTSGDWWREKDGHAMSGISPCRKWPASLSTA